MVGEDGSGKTTLGLALLRLIRSEGGILLVTRGNPGLGVAAASLRRHMQIVFQDPYGSLSPRMSVGQIVEEGLKLHGIGDGRQGRRRLVAKALQEVGLDPVARAATPTSSPAGNGNASASRAIVLRPSFVVLDRPTSALDMSVQRRRSSICCAICRRGAGWPTCSSVTTCAWCALSDQVIVMRDGQVVEHGPTQEIFERPRHSYTRALMAAAFEIEAVETEYVAT